MKNILSLREGLVQKKGGGAPLGCKYVPEELKKAARKELGAASEKDIVQSDYTQNDTTALSYIKNRPFYVSDELQEIISETNIITTEDEPIILIEGNFYFNKGSTYIVIFDGVEYKCDVWMFGDYMALGNSSLEGLEGGNDVPFIIVLTNDEVRLASEHFGEHTFGIKEFKIHKLDAKYLPSNIPYTENGKIPGNYITEKFPDVHYVFDDVITVGMQWSTLANPYPNKITIGLSIEKFNSYFDGTLDLPKYCIIDDSIATISLIRAEKLINVRWMRFSIYDSAGYEIAGAHCEAYDAKIHEDASNPGTIVSEYAIVKVADGRLT